MRYATALVATLAIGAAASIYTPKADAGVVVGIGLPVPVAAPPVAYYPYGPAPFVGEGVGFGGPAFYRHGYYGPGFRGPLYSHPGFAHSGYWHGGYFHGGLRR